MKKPKLKILSIDGGGIRGIIPCKILSFIEEFTGKPISHFFDLIVGTSTGGIIASGLVTLENKSNSYFREPKFSARDLLHLYKEKGDEIFSKRKQDLLGKFGQIAGGVVKMALDKPFDEQVIEKLLDEYFGEVYLRDELCAELLITSYDIKQGKPFYFSSRLARQGVDENFRLKEITRATSAAPTYFAPSEILVNNKQSLVLVDGGVFANNPSILAYSEGKELWKIKEHKGIEPQVLPDDDDYPFYLLSLGTGYSKNEISEQSKDFRAINWFSELPDILMRSVAESTDFTMQHLLPPYKDGSLRYQRLQISLPEENMGMDNVSKENIEFITQQADKFIDENKDLLIDICDDYLS